MYIYNFLTLTLTLTSPILASPTPPSRKPTKPNPNYVVKIFQLPIPQTGGKEGTIVIPKSSTPVCINTPEEWLHSGFAGIFPPYGTECGIYALEDCQGLLTTVPHEGTNNYKESYQFNAPILSWKCHGF